MIRCDNSILVVDDAQIARDIESTFLIHAGYDVIEAADGDEAIQKFVQFHPSLVILDIIMPRVDGIHVLRTMKKIDPSAQILICTAADDYRIINLALQDGAAGYIIKPYKGDELIKKVQILLKEQKNSSADI